MIDWKTEGLDDFEKTFRRYQDVSSKSFEDSVKHRVGQLGFSLFFEFKRIASKSRRAILRRPARHMRVKGENRTQKQEKARRIFALGYVSTGWIPAMLKFRRAGASAIVINPVKNPQGDVKLNLRGAIRTAELINSTPGAYEADQKHGLSGKAFKRQTADMQKYLDRKAKENIRRAGF